MERNTDCCFVCWGFVATRVMRGHSLFLVLLSRFLAFVVIMKSYNK